MKEEAIEQGLVKAPAHIPAHLIVDFDMYNVPGGSEDAQAAYSEFQRSGPDIFWTPRNGGHWVATRADHIEAILRDSESFSSRRVFIPRDDSAPPTLPLEADAPVHTDMRKPLSRGLFPKAVDAMEPVVTELVVSLIESFRARGECEFMSEFGNVMPMYVFLDLVNLPRSESETLVPIVERFIKSGSIEERQQAQAALIEYISGVTLDRRANPGEDLGSKVVNATVAGERIGDFEAISYMTLLLLGGLDTIASMLGFITRFLAQSPEHRRQLVANIDDAAYVRSAMEEMFRRFGIVNAGRVVARDCEVAGVRFREDDTILPINMLAGLDERRIDNPLAIDFSRGSSTSHLAFGAGPHSCPGSTLARREIAIFLREWLKRIPDFSIKAGGRSEAITGVTCSLKALDLVWPT